MSKILDRFKVDKYYKMSNHDLELEASKYKIGGYGNPNTGRVIRERIITQLLEKDKANNSRFAIVISLIALFISILGLIF